MLVMIAAGETVDERNKVFLGCGDSLFTEEGREDLQFAAETLQPYRFDQAFASDLYRAQETLRLILTKNHHRDTPWELVEELRERSGGSYEGRKYADIRKGMSPKEYKVWERDPFEAPLHGESLVDVRDRLSPWVTEVLSPLLAANKSILVVSHPDTIRVLISLVRGDDLGENLSTRIEHAIPYFYHGPTR